MTRYSLEHAPELIDFVYTDERWLSKLNKLIRPRSILAQTDLEKPPGWPYF